MGQEEELTGQGLDDDEGRSRRQYERVAVTHPIKLEATLKGRFIDIMQLEMSGTTIDVSDGGFLAHVNQSISPGVRCRVEIPNLSEDGPKTLWGRVRRSIPQDDGTYALALEFDEPIETNELLEQLRDTGNPATVVELAQEHDDAEHDDRALAAS